MAQGARLEGRVIALIPAHNEEASIGETIRSLRQQTRPVDRIIVVCDNCTDGTADVAILCGAEAIATLGNTAKKAGALNQALRWILPCLGSSDLVLVMYADSQLNGDWIRVAAAAMRDRASVGASCGAFLAEDGGGLVGQLQRNEYVRYARSNRRRRQVPVLSGTGTLFRVTALREVARERGQRLPGVYGDFYNSASITEDDEMTLALKTLGWRCECPPGCETVTEVMPTWGDLFWQRIRWQKGALGDLRAYGVSRVTMAYWLRQALIYLAFGASIACWAIIISSLAGHPAINVPWTAGVLSVTLTERLWTVRRAGTRGLLLCALVIPEMGYDMFRFAYFARALADELLHRERAWNHVVRAAA
jgi:cellulose synthase/poly-beta-1,6-N-acetylglucosamine synthase-like glycosyltransferase